MTILYSLSTVLSKNSHAWKSLQTYKNCYIGEDVLFLCCICPDYFVVLKMTAIITFNHLIYPRSRIKAQRNPLNLFPRFTVDHKSGVFECIHSVPSFSQHFNIKTWYFTIVSSSRQIECRIPHLRIQWKMLLTLNIFICILKLK